MLAVPLRHEREEPLCPRGRGGYADPLRPADQAVPLHRPEPGEDVVMGDPEVLGKFPGCGETYGDAARVKTDGYAPILFEEDSRGRFDYIVMFVCGHPIVEVLAPGAKKG